MKSLGYLDRGWQVAFAPLTPPPMTLVGCVFRWFALEAWATHRASGRADLLPDARGVEAMLWRASGWLPDIPTRGAGGLLGYALAHLPAPGDDTPRL